MLQSRVSETRIPSKCKLMCDNPSGATTVSQDSNIKSLSLDRPEAVNEEWQEVKCRRVL
jgi:hypothetical protein